ncbi:MAG: tRNA (guanosine(46)-N7)-methyltransferase TrmB [Eggerthellales bacterium]|nr:tRNA (guanosine(46)-N7)-methyltransferase TrmB [Eggerthellales bacterium]
MRARRPENLINLLAQYDHAIISDPQSHKGRWKADFMPQATEVRLDLGCGKGRFAIEAARLNPECLFVAMDVNDICVLNAARNALESGVKNLVVVLGNADDLEKMFAPRELCRIYLNFNAPFPKRKRAHLRLTHLDRLLEYRRLLGPEGLIDLRTDNMPYWRYTLDELDSAGYRVLSATENLHATPHVEGPLPRSEYDLKLSAAGAPVYALIAQAGPEPDLEHMQRTARLSLVDYLPEDLSQLTHIPYGMEDTVVNLSNRKANARARAARAQDTNNR